MQTQEQKTKLDNYLNKVRKAISSEKDMINLVNSIETGIKTTQDNYGKYMQILTPYIKDKSFCFGVALGLIDIGADRQGIMSALKVLGMIS